MLPHQQVRIGRKRKVFTKRQHHYLVATGMFSCAMCSIFAPEFHVFKAFLEVGVAYTWLFLEPEK